jgi:hypothetical protein
MADIVVSFPAPDSTSVDAFLARELAEGRALGAPVASSTVAGRQVEFTGLVEGEAYLATDGSRSVRFTIEAPPAATLLSRLDALETAVPQKADASDLTAHAALATPAHGGIVASTDTRLTDARTPAGGAGGVLAGTFPSPSFAADMATQAELNTVSALTPTSTQKAALAGSVGTPGSSNPYVTSIDTRMRVVSVASYGAVGNSSTDDRAAIQAAIDAAATAGVPVYFPAISSRIYAISGPLVLHAGTKLIGDHTPNWLPTSRFSVAIQGRSGFSGSSLLQVWDNALTGEAAQPTGGMIQGLVLNGGGIAAHGIYARGGPCDWKIADVEIAGCTSHGLRLDGYGSTPVQEWNLHHVHSWGNAGAGFYASSKSYDHRFLACVAHGNADSGFVLDTDCASIEHVSCRAEWQTGGSGYVALSGDKVSYVGCVTDRNAANGFYLSYSAGGPLMLRGCFVNRDVVAGIRVHASNLCVIDAVQRRGANDDGSGTVGPVYGLDVTGASKVLAGGLFAGQTNATHSDGAGGQVVHYVIATALDTAGTVTYWTTP